MLNVKPNRNLHFEYKGQELSNTGDNYKMKWQNTRAEDLRNSIVKCFLRTKHSISINFSQIVTNCWVEKVLKKLVKIFGQFDVP